MDSLRSWLLIILLLVLALLFIAQWIASSSYGQTVKRSSGNEFSARRSSYLDGYVRNRFLFITALYAAWTGVYLFFPVWTAERFDLYLFNFIPFQIIGFIIASGGLFLNVYAQFQLGRNFRTGIREGEKTELIRDGVYSYMRNPMYAGLLVAQFGLVLILPDTISISLMVITFLMLEIQIRQEEDHLEILHGAEFQNYRRSVPRYLPIRFIKRILGFRRNVAVLDLPGKSSLQQIVADESKETAFLSPVSESAISTMEISQKTETKAEASADLQFVEAETDSHNGSDDLPAETSGIYAQAQTEEADDVEMEFPATETTTNNTENNRMESVLKKMMQKNRR